MAAGFFPSDIPKIKNLHRTRQVNKVQWDALESIGISVMRPDILRKQRMLELLDVQKNLSIYFKKLSIINQNMLKLNYLNHLESNFRLGELFQVRSIP
jgi:hypothetical protein